MEEMSLIVDRVNSRVERYHFLYRYSELMTIIIHQKAIELNLQLYLLSLS